MKSDLFQYLSFLIGSIGVILGLFFAIILLLTRHRRFKANIFLAIYLIAFSLRIGKSVFHNFIELDSVVRTFFLAMLLCVGPSIWLYTKILRTQKETLQKYIPIHFLPFILSALLCSVIPNDGSLGSGFFYNFLIAHMSIYILYSIIYLVNSNSTIDSFKTTLIIKWLYTFLVSNGILVILYFLISIELIPYYLGLSFTFTSVILFLAFWILKKPLLLEKPKKRYENSRLDSVGSIRIIKRLETYVKNEKPYLNPTMTISNLSNDLEVSSKELSQAINQIKSINYSHYVSELRVNEVLRLMKNPQNQDMTISSLAYESGFNSISSFNSAFKKITGITAKQFRETLSNK